MLEVHGLEAAYNESQVLFGVDLTIGSGELVTLLGRNGMGKTTTVRCIMGLLKPRSGEINFAGRSIAGKASFRIARTGLGLVPEGRQIFPNLTVRENLIATARLPHSAGEQPERPWTLDRVMALFPILRERSAHWGNQLSGGEQQMLAIARALMTNPRLLILDEATEGLAPLIREEIWSTLAELKAQGLALLVIDKHVSALADMADHHVILERGRVVWQGNSDDMRRNADLTQSYLGV